MFGASFFFSFLLNSTSGSFQLERGANIFKGAYTFKNKQMSDLIDNLWI